MINSSAVMYVVSKLNKLCVFLSTFSFQPWLLKSLCRLMPGSRRLLTEPVARVGKEEEKRGK